MKMIKWLSVLACFAIGLVTGNMAHAAPTHFSVTAIIPNNQIDKRQTYFDLRMVPKQTQTIQVRIDNISDQKITVIPSIINATTTLYGDINYTDKHAKMDESMKFPLTSIVKQVRPVTLNGRESRLLPLKLVMPEEKQNGVILGSIHFIEKNNSTVETQKHPAVLVQNQYAYVIGLKLTEGTAVQPDLHFNSIKKQTLNNQKIVSVNIQNSRPVIVHDLSVKTRLMKAGSEKILQSSIRKNMRMAPNSNFDLPIIRNLASLHPGKYVVHLSAEANGQSWKADRTFVIKGDEAAPPHRLSPGAPFYKWLGGAVFIVCIAVIFYLLGKRQRKSKREKKGRTNK
ncbi:DUF916 and DUF3324 domain-containing protein [Sporolactobacillus sp. THM19-2]|uniref:DUF916 and DUF3324 domain-containing protein n=1 Tax=Sporolactobacillus sp. THM19-2 TaxID=2511171 RepID=UPI00102261B3|nr:DUF916 and DUF3324 domain-containing protein [Sporolactobacillus sp. THM19-2]RYL94084.1 DUF916 and DUF3324 domain-containing protein [Sporolactobacillus sp. THM19-2]